MTRRHSSSDAFEDLEKVSAPSSFSSSRVLTKLEFSLLGAKMDFLGRLEWPESLLDLLHSWIDFRRLELREKVSLGRAAAMAIARAANCMITSSRGGQLSLSGEMSMINEQEPGPVAGPSPSSLLLLLLLLSAAAAATGALGQSLKLTAENKQLKHESRGSVQALGS